MFPRSDNTEEIVDPMAEPSGQRSPMVLAALAGLLAIAGAFLLVWYVSSGSDDVATSTDATTAPTEANRQVLVVVETIPRNTSVSELIEAPTVYLSARAVPEQFVAESAITSVAELRELAGMVLASDALAGEQLLRGRFRDPNDFGSSGETFLEAGSGFEIPAGHHAVVLELPSRRALGGNIAPGEKVTVVGGFRVSPPGSDAFDMSVVVMNQVEVLSIQSSLEVVGQLSSDLNQTGTASRGSFTITVAVTPEELTDLVYTTSYGEVTLATAVEGLDNGDGPRAATLIDQIVGDDGVWLAEIEDGNLIDIVSAYSAEQGPEGESIQLDLPGDEDNTSDVGLATQEDDIAGDS